MPEIRVENHLPHFVNTAASPEFADFAGRQWEEREYVPRADEVTVAVLGLVRVRGIEIPVLQRRFTDLIYDEGIPYDSNVFKIVSYETIAAAQRSGRPIDDLGYPWGIVRDPDGRVLGARGFGMPQPFEPLGTIEPALRPEDIPLLGDPDGWVNTANFPTKLYDPSVLPPQGDLIDSSIQPLLALPRAKHPVDVSPAAETDWDMSERFGVPIVRVQPNPAPGGITNLPENRETLHVLHPLALRHVALLGRSVRLCGVSGGLARSRETGTVLGGTAIYVFDPDMIASDRM